MKLTIDIDALISKHSFSNGGVEHILEVRLLGHKLEVPVKDKIIEALDSFISNEFEAQPEPTHREVRREYPTSYSEPVEYEFGSVSLADMEDNS